jgi:endonuclease YncB( thermonuclease family)
MLLTIWLYVKYQSKYSALHMACFGGNMDIAEELIRNGADITLIREADEVSKCI